MSEENTGARADANVSGGISVDAKRNVYLTKVNAWLTSASVIEQNLDKLEKFEQDAYIYIRNVFDNPDFDKTALVEHQNVLRDAANAFTDSFGVALGKFASATGSVLKNYDLFRDCLEEVQSKATSAAKTIGESEPQKKQQPQSGIHQDSRIIGGAKWEGTFNGDTPYGSGIIYFKNGTVYKGEWNAEGPNGKGTLEWNNGDKWIATFVNGDPVSGVIEYGNGSKYEGGLNENGPHGRGRSTYPNRVDEGEYSDGERVGTGRMDWSDGDWYVGGWSDDGFEGEGTYFSKQYNRTDHGTYSAGKRVGRGRMEWGSGRWYEGEWNDEGSNGKGVLHFADGTECKGDFVNGQRSGNGVMTFRNGDKYVGTWTEDDEGNLYGEGVYTWVNGSKQSGKYVKGKWVAERTTRAVKQTPTTSQEKQGHFTPPAMPKKTTSQPTPTIVEHVDNTDSRKTVISYIFVVIRNIVAWVISLAVFALTFAYMQGPDSAWNMIWVCVIMWLAQWIYAGDGIFKDSWWNPLAIFGVVLIINALIYLCSGIFGTGGSSLIIAGVFWGFVGFMAIGKAFDD